MSRDSHATHGRSLQEATRLRATGVTRGHRPSIRATAPHGRESDPRMPPQFTIFAKVDMTSAMQLRQQMQDDGVPATYNDIFVRAAALALTSFPTLNARYERSRIVPQDYIDVGIVIATKGAQTFGSVKDADSLSLPEVSAETRRLSEQAWGGELPGTGRDRPATFTVSNLGMYGVSKFSGYVVPHQAALLSVGAIEVQPVAAADAGVQTLPIAEVGLTCDHRVVSAADAAFFIELLTDLLTSQIGDIGAR